MGVIDVLVIITVFLSVIFALYRGLVRELLGITSWIVAGIAGLYSYSWMQPLIGKVIDNEVIAGIIGSVLVAVGVLVFMTLLNAGITSKLRESSLSGLDRILGLLFGVFRAWLLLGIVYIGASMIFSSKQLLTAEEENVSVYYIQQSAGVLEKFIPETIKKDIKSYEQGKLKDKQLKKIGTEIKKEIKKEVATEVEELKEEAVEYKEEARESLDALIKEVN
ncbi:MAG: CvpA family protein [Alphaproteobacteria bacterium]|nr:CvpA family protein [Alphaproteobacteria bacterium]